MFRKSKDYENALKSCDKALKADPKYLDGWNEKAAIYIDKAEYKKAIEACDIAIKINPKYFYAHNNKAVASRKLGDYEKALKSCDEALKINPKYSDAQNEKNNILQAFYFQIAGLITKKQYDEAIKACDIIINSDAKNLHAYHNKVMALRMLEDYENALKNCDKSILYMGNIDNYGIGKVEQLNQLYLERKKQHVEAAAKRDYLYSQGVINGVNGFDWYKANPTRDFYSFFRDTLKVSDKSPENLKLIKERLYKNLSPYLEEAKKSNYFLDEYNKYYKDMMASKEKLSQLIDICNIKAIASKKLGDYEKALESCDIAIKINPKDLTASNFKSFILKEKTDFEKAIEYSDGTFRIKPSYQMSNFDYFLKLPYLSKVSTIDLSNKQIDDKGAKLLADSLSKGEMPKLKVLRLEDNKITKEGMNYFPFAIDKMKQDIKVTLLDLYNESKEGMHKSYHLSPLGDKQIKKEILTNYLEMARNQGLDVDNIAVDRTTWGFIKNKVKVSTSFLAGFAKCLIPKDGKELLTDMAIEKNPKIIKKTIVYIQNASCFDEALDESRLTESGVALTKYELELIGNTNSNNNAYEDVLIKVSDFLEALQ
ncbi:MAG: tetratricopeptide repeat protein [Candidatus Megaira endosymbiont of Carteria cerasiformis]|nr:tetratricopeptide repeat protein [Candidatus Megaera polyxenophila]MCC8461299.1 tetratricopeptide repeat protein [Candidatus Megaera polyxenophila]